MAFVNDLKQILESEEKNTVSDAFGGDKSSGRTPSFSLPKIRDWIVSKKPYDRNTETEAILTRAYDLMPGSLFPFVLACALRFSFLIELTNLSLGSTKMKTRWLPGYILMPQERSFEPIKGLFSPGQDARAAPFNDCLGIFEAIIDTTCNHLEKHPELQEILMTLREYNSFPYEFSFDYIDVHHNPMHHRENIHWILNDDLLWLLKARKLLSGVLERQEANKIQTKTYKTDRALTGVDKTNRAKRWEVLANDFQHASISECWSVERKIIRGLVCFEAFPEDVKNKFIMAQLIDSDAPATICPVTLLPLNYEQLINAAKHGISQYQIGHLHPLKRGGKHRGDNICWESADGNRIQGDLTMEETISLLKGIATRMI